MITSTNVINQYVLQLDKETIVKMYKDMTLLEFYIFGVYGRVRL